MSSLFVDRRNVHLSVESGALVFRENDERVGTVPLAPLRRVVLRGSVQLSAAVLGQLGEQGVGVLVLSGRQATPSLMLARPHNDARRRVAQVRCSLDEAFCLNFAQELIRTKLERQRAWLDALRADALQARYPLTRAMNMLEAQRERAAETTSLAELRGVEGVAARTYFAALTEVVPPALGFHGRNRRPPRDPFNVLLSLTYTMLHAELAMVLHGAGFDPYVGFYHQISFGRESLASDMLEPLRSLADRFCLDLVRQQTLRAEHFSLTDNGCLLGKAGRVHYYEAYEAQRVRLNAAATVLVEHLEATVDPDSVAAPA